MYKAQNFKTDSKTTISQSKFYLIPGSYTSLWNITNYRNEILQCHRLLSALRYLLFYTFILDGFGEIHIYRKGGTVLIKCSHLIWA
jgi:hypothetical protein